MTSGTISELSAQDGLGWIQLDDGGERLRFGATACKGFVPAVGMRVSVLETAPGFRGVIKATHVAPLAAKPGAAGQGPARRANLAKLEGLGVTVDDALRLIVGHADADESFSKDLTHLQFELAPSRAADVGCAAEGFFVVAKDASGNAFGLYAGEGAPGTPWVYWDREIDTLAFVAPDTRAFIGGLLVERAQRVKDPEAIKRVRSVLSGLGVGGSSDAEADTFLDGQPVRWLPRGPLRR